MTNRFNLYLGKAGHLAIMAEFLLRGWNVAIPEVDIGDDIFVVQDSNGTLKRVQVKTASARKQKSGFSARFLVPKAQLAKIAQPLINYVFLARNGDEWMKPLIIPQDILKDYIENKGVGAASSRFVNLYFSFKGEHVTCSKLDFSSYVRDYSGFPLIPH